jgi:hypothetical protein
MTADGLRKPGQRGDSGDAARSVAQKPRGDGGGPTTTVPVIPLWERLSKGAHG